MVRLGVSLLTLALVAVPASACINDKELPSHEREFRSEYSRQMHPTPKVKDRTVPAPLLIGSGAALLGGAFVAAFKVTNRPKG